MDDPTGHLLNLPAWAKPDGRSYVLAHVRLDGDLRGDVISVFPGHNGFVMLRPVGGGRFQCIATDPSARSGDRGGPGMAELQQLIDGCLPASARLRQTRWSSRFLAARRLSPPLRHGRVFFGGDSAYAYSPATGQGANSGIQDMINLGWKLAMVLQEKAAPDLLGTYAEERLQVISQLERKTEVPAYLLGSSSALARKLVTRIAPTFHDSNVLLDLCADALSRRTAYASPPDQASWERPAGRLPAGTARRRRLSRPAPVLSCGGR